MDQQVMDKLISMETNLSKAISDVTQRVINIETSLATMLDRMIQNEKAIEELKIELSETQARLNVRDQRDLVNFFRVTGLPPMNIPKKQEMELMITILSKVDVPATANDFEYVRMYKTANNSSSTLTGKFVNQMKRKEAFMAFRAKAKATGITWNQIVEPCDPNDGLRKLYLRSNLTKPTMILLNRAREHKDKFQFIWEEEGRILLRKKDKEPAIELKSVLQLQQLVEPQSERRRPCIR